MNPTRRDFQRTLRDALAEVATEAFPDDPHGIRKVQLTPRLRAEAVKRARSRTRGTIHE